MDGRFSQQEILTRLKALHASPQNPSPETTATLDAALLDVINCVGPRSYDLILKKPNAKTVGFLALGCNGKPGPILSELAMLMTTIVNNRPDIHFVCRVFLGDLFYYVPMIYKSGLETWRDPRVKQQIIDVFHPPTLPENENLFSELVAGNHDGSEYNQRSPGEFCEDVGAYVVGKAVNTGKAFFQATTDMMFSSWKSSRSPSPQPIELPIKPYSITHLPALNYGQNFEKRETSEAKLIKKRMKLFSENEIKVAELPPIVMPYYFDSSRIGNMQTLTLNSNTLVKDFLVLFTYLINQAHQATLAAKPPEDCRAFFLNFIKNAPEQLQINQIVFALRTYAQAKLEGKPVILKQHHPLKAVGKRAKKKCDADHYLAGDKVTATENIMKFDLIAQILERLFFPQFNQQTLNVKEQILLLKKIIDANEEELKRNIISGEFPPLSEDYECYNLMLTKICCLLAMHFLAVVAAHEHFLCFFNNAKQLTNTSPLSSYQICQITAGASSHPSNLHQQEDFSNHESIKYWGNTPGVTTLYWDQANPHHLHIDIQTVDGRVVKFTNQEEGLVRMASPDKDIETIREKILKACNKYKKFIEDEQTTYRGKFFSQNMTHSQKDFETMHELINYLNQETLPDREKFKNEVNIIVKKLSNRKSENALYRDVDLILQEHDFVVVEYPPSPDNELQNFLQSFSMDDNPSSVFSSTK